MRGKLNYAPSSESPTRSPEAFLHASKLTRPIGASKIDQIEWVILKDRLYG
jgi:hypothetical protein